MAVCVVGSVHGSPGATSLAIDLASVAQLRGSENVLLIEADPDGGCLAARLDLAIRPGLTELAGTARVGIDPDDLWKFAQPLPNGVGVVVAHPAAEQVQAALRAAVNHIATALSSCAHTVIVDVGRLRPGSPALAFVTIADRVLVVSRNSVEAIVSLTHRAPLLRGLCDPSVVLTDGKPYDQNEIEQAVDLDTWGVVPHASDRRRARSRRERLDALCDGIHTAPQAFAAPGAPRHEVVPA